MQRTPNTFTTVWLIHLYIRTVGVTFRGVLIRSIPNEFAFNPGCEKYSIFCMLSSNNWFIDDKFVPYGIEARSSKFMSYALRLKSEQFYPLLMVLRVR